MAIFDLKAIQYIEAKIRSTITRGVSVLVPSGTTASVKAANGDGAVELMVNGDGERGVYDSTTGKWLVKTDGTDTILPHGDVNITGERDSQQQLTGGNLNVEGKVTANGGIETSTITSSGGISVQGAMTVTGAVTFESTLDVEGKLNAGDIDCNDVDARDMSARSLEIKDSLGNTNVTFSSNGNITTHGEINVLDSNGNVVVGINSSGSVSGNNINASGDVVSWGEIKVYDANATILVRIDRSGDISARDIRIRDIGVTGEIYRGGTLYIQQTPAGGVSMCQGGGLVYIEGNQNGYGLKVTQKVEATGFDTSSDERLKIIRDDIKLTVDQLASAPSVLFNWKRSPGGEVQGGTLAQYWQKVAPWAVKEDSQGMLTVDYGALALAGVIALAREMRGGAVNG